ncbi:MAG: protein phosphatase 2C domain-containing protein [Firmicutes bacterium]|nr:protein phosphatase 2C domain-containing protein [Bacillota bacterium]
MKITTGSSVYHYPSHLLKGKTGRKDGQSVECRKTQDGKDLYFFLVCDAEAEFNENFASIALKTVMDSCISDFRKIVSEEKIDWEQQLDNILKNANSKLYDKEQTEAVEMGASLTLAVLEGTKLFTAHIGNCRLYLFRDGRTDQITVDQSLVIKPSDYNGTESQSKRVIVRKIGIEEMTLPQFDTRELFPGDRLLFCTDGLYNVLSDEDITRITSAEEDCTRQSEKLTDSAKLRDADDNIAAISVCFCREKGKTKGREPLKKVKKEVKAGSEINRIAVVFFVIVFLAGIAALFWYFADLRSGRQQQESNDQETPRFRIESGKSLKKLTVNGKDRTTYLQNGKAFYRLKQNVSKFMLDAAAPWSASLEIPAGAETTVNYGKDNIINIEQGTVRIWVETGSSVSVDNNGEGNKKEKSAIHLKDLKKELYINFLSPTEVKLKMD